MQRKRKMFPGSSNSRPPPPSPTPRPRQSASMLEVTPRQLRRSGVRGELCLSPMEKKAARRKKRNDEQKTKHQAKQAEHAKKRDLHFWTSSSESEMEEKQAKEKEHAKQHEEHEQHGPEPEPEILEQRKKLRKIETPPTVENRPASAAAKKRQLQVRKTIF